MSINRRKSDTVVNTFDIDGVLYMNRELPMGVSVNPGNSVIITGRSFEEERITREQLKNIGIPEDTIIHFNPLPFSEKTRESSGQHKARMILWLKTLGYEHGYHFEDDEIQVKIIRENVPGVRIVHLVHDFTEKENVDHEAK